VGGQDMKECQKEIDITRANLKAIWLMKFMIHSQLYRCEIGFA
jgi:hypothetical protein